MLETLINDFIGGLYPFLISWKTRSRPYFQLWDVLVKLATFKACSLFFWLILMLLNRFLVTDAPAASQPSISVSLQGLSIRTPTQRCSAWPCRTAAWPTWGGWTKPFRTTEASRPRPGTTARTLRHADASCLQQLWTQGITTRVISSFNYVGALNRVV